MLRTDLQADIEQRLATAEPAVEVLACEDIGKGNLRLTIDREGGVDLELCERVTGHLRELLLDHGLEVSSPGPERPLAKPDHFRRYVGRRARVRTLTEREGRRKFTGELVEATDDHVTVAVGGAEGGEGELGLVSIPYTEIDRSNLLEG